MKTTWIAGLSGVALFLGGNLMAKELLGNWVTVKDEKTGLQADFPHQPLEMTFEIPFQNTPPIGQIHLYSMPTQSGIMVLCTYASDEIDKKWQTKDKLHYFFESILAPYFFFNPSIFKNKQVFEAHPAEILGKKGVAFDITYSDHGIIKKMEGQALVKEHTLYVYFYLASENHFDYEILNKFFESVHIS